MARRDCTQPELETVDRLSKADGFAVKEGGGPEPEDAQIGKGKKNCRSEG